MLLSVQALGQITLGFELSIAQLLLSIGTCAVIGVVSEYRTERALVWPASAMLTGNGIALILRVRGTEHGDWWSLHGWHIFVATAVLGMASKTLFRARGRHVFNPSNVALVATFLILGSGIVEPLDFWWGRMTWGLAAALLLISIGGALITWRSNLLVIALSFWGVFTLALLALGAADHCMTARWSIRPMCGTDFTRVISGSPETLIFSLFMVTDPRTVPVTPRARRWFGPIVAVLAGGIIATQRSEFGHKVALLGALSVVCAASPLLERVFDGPSTGRDVVPVPPRLRWLGRAGAVATVATLTVFGLQAPTVPASFEPAPGRPPAIDRQVEMPRIEVAESDRVATHIPLHDAERIVADTLGDLAAQTDALLDRDGGALTATADGPWLADLRSRLATVERGEAAEATRYRPERAVVSIARRAGQAAPALLVTLIGPAESIDLSNGTSRSIGSRRLTVEVQYRDSGRYVIVTDRPPDGFVAPR